MHEGIKQPGGMRFQIPDSFRVPLNRPEEGFGRIIHSLNNTVLTSAHGHKTGRQCLDRLMMVTVDTKPQGSAKGMQR